jgi:glycosyltransferase involved in cell wall biosynthesis
MADHYIVHTMQNKQELACITKTQKPITVLPHGLILTQPQDIDRQQARQELGILPTDKVALCFGAIRDYKGLDTAIKALALVQDKDIKLMVAGQCWEDWSKYEKLIIEYQLQERIILKLGFIPTDQVDAIIKSSDLILLPYKHFDAQSGVGALVLPYGIPIIVSRVGGLIDYTTDQNLSFEADDVDDLAVKINNIFINENLYSKSIKAMDEMMQVLDWSVITNSLVKLYRSTSK